MLILWIYRLRFSEIWLPAETKKLRKGFDIRWESMAFRTSVLRHHSADVPLQLEQGYSLGFSWVPGIRQFKQAMHGFLPLVAKLVQSDKGI